MLGLHPEPGSETDQAEAGRHRDDGVVRFACDDAELVPEVGQRNTVAQPDEQGRRIRRQLVVQPRSEEHTSELQSLMRISYAVFCLKKKKKKPQLDSTQ